MDRDLSYTRDAYGRINGYSLSWAGRVVNTELMGYDEVRRLLSLTMDGLPQATFGYRADNGLPDFLTYPSGMTKKIACEAQRNTISSVSHKSYQGAFIDSQSAVHDSLSRVTTLN